MFEASSFDQDLNPVLQAATDAQLDPLVKSILEAKFSQKLSSHELYKLYAPVHSKYSDVIAKEIRAFGGHTVANLVRGGIGPSYSEIVHDVADKLKIDYLSDISVPKLERLILIKIMMEICKKMSPEELAKLRSDFDNCNIDLDLLLQNIQLNDKFMEHVSPTMLVMASTVIAATVVRMAALGALGATAAVGTVAGFGLGRILGVLGGPIGWGATIAYTLFEAGKSAFRVTIPCVVQVALIRLYQEADVDQKRYLDYLQDPARLTSDQPKFLSYEQYKRLK